MHNTEEKLKAFERLLEIMDELREKCPWDREQTLESLRNLTIEETYELADAIMDQDLDEIRKELGDLILHIVFYSKIGSEKKAFDIATNRGYYDYPRNAELKNLAQEMGVSLSTYREHLRKAEKKIIPHYRG